MSLAAVLPSVRRKISGPDYIQEIDGLRAFAVAAVMLFHAFPSVIPGGYIGVDVFFVVSGFVISRTYLRRLVDHQISLGQFYLRRIRRLAPAYVVVLVVSTLAAYLLLEPPLLRNFGESLVAQPFYAQNFVFWVQGDYFEAEFTKPLLHTWSLAAEEQFYLLFAVLIGLTRWRRFTLLPLLLASAALSFSVGYALAGISPKTGFFLVPTRIWEFSIGILAYLIVERVPIRPGGGRAIGMFWLSGAVLVLTCLVFDETTPFPGPQALLASLATLCLLILFECRPSDRYGILTAGPIRRTGELSYSLYLWHWPVLVFLLAAVGRDLRWYEATAALAVSISLAELTYRFIENPVRRRKSLSTTTKLLTGWGMASSGVLVVGLLITSTDGALFRYSEPVRTLFAAAQEMSPYRCPKLFRILNPTAEFCPINDASGTNGVLILGDSHADQLDEMIADIGANAEIPVYLTVRNCDFDELTITDYCDASVRSTILSQAQEAGINYVIATSFWPESGLNEAVFRKNVQAFAEAGIVIYFSEVVPHGMFFNPEQRARALLAGSDVPPQPYTLSDYTSDVALQRKIFENLTASFPEVVRILHPVDYLCSKKGCDFATDGYPNYFDGSHLTHVGATRLRPMYAGVIDQVRLHVGL